MPTAKIKALQKISERHWYGTTKDSHLHCEEPFIDRYFTDVSHLIDISGNNGSYSFNFNSSDLNTILSVLKANNIDVMFIKVDKDIPWKEIEITKEEYLQMTKTIIEDIDEARRNSYLFGKAV